MQLTGKQMCEAISRWLKEKHGIDKAPSEIWNADPSGGIWHVCELYELAARDGYTVVETDAPLVVSQ